MPGLRKAVVVGINYAGTPAELHGPVNDALHWVEVLTEHCSFRRRDIIAMIDEYPSGEPVEADDPNYVLPTKESIMEALDWLVQDVHEGDCILFVFSGHGVQVRDPWHAAGRDRLEEALCPSDWAEFDWGLVPHRLVTTDVLQRYFAKLPSGVILTLALDTSLCGVPLRLPLLIDLEFPDRELDVEAVTQDEYTGMRFDCGAWLRSQSVNALPRRLPLEPQRPLWSRLLGALTTERAPLLDEGVAAFCIVACRGSQTALDASIDGLSQGCMTYCLMKAFEKLHYRCSYLELCEAMDHVAHDLRMRVAPYMDQFCQLSYAKNAGPDECLVLDAGSAYVAKDKARRRRGQRRLPV